MRGLAVVQTGQVSNPPLDEPGHHAPDTRSVAVDVGLRGPQAVRPGLVEAPDVGDLLVGLRVLHEVDRVLVSARTAAERRVQQVLGEDDQVAGPGLRGVAGKVGGREAEGAELRVGVVLPEQAEAVRVRGNVGARNEPERAGVLRQLVQVEVDLDRQRLVTGARRPRARVWRRSSPGPRSGSRMKSGPSRSTPIW